MIDEVDTQAFTLEEFKDEDSEQLKSQCKHRSFHFTQLIFVPPGTREVAHHDLLSIDQDNLHFKKDLPLHLPVELHKFCQVSTQFSGSEVTNNSSAEELDYCKSISEKLEQLKSCSVTELFLHYFSNDVQRLILSESNRYAKEIGIKNFDLEVNDLYRWLGIMYITGYNKVPRLSDYWSQTDDLGVPIIASQMSNTKFNQISQLFEGVCQLKCDMSGNMTSGISILYRLLNDTLKQFGVFCNKLCLGDQMLPYVGLETAEQTIQNRGVQLGYKLWTITCEHGYPMNVLPYFPKHGTLSNTKEIKQDYECKLIEDLKMSLDRNQKITTVDMDTSSYPVPLKIERKVSVKSEETTNFTIDIKSAEQESATSGHVSEQQQVSPKKKKLFWYPKTGADLLVSYTAQYRSPIQQQNWHWPLFRHCLELFRIAPFLLYNHLHPNKPINNLDFTRTIVRGLLEINNEPRMVNFCLSSNKEVGKFARNFIDMCDNRHPLHTFKQGRCVVCKKNTRLRCSVCKVLLHWKCSIHFHN